LHRVTLTVAAALFMLLLDGSILNTSLPAMANALHVRPLTLSAAVTVYLLAAAAVLPLASWLGERFGLRRILCLRSRCSPLPRSSAAWRRIRRSSCWPARCKAQAAD